MIIVKSKRTGKYLKRHSGSYNKFRSKIRYQNEKKAEEMMGSPRPIGRLTGSVRKFAEEWYDEYYKILDEIVHNKIFSAEALESRIYHSTGSCLNSVGIWKNHKNHWPEDLEMHEIVAGNLCLVNPDDDDETKRRKERNCK